MWLTTLFLKAQILIYPCIVSASTMSSIQTMHPVQMYKGYKSFLDIP